MNHSVKVGAPVPLSHTAEVITTTTKKSKEGDGDDVNFNLNIVEPPELVEPNEPQAKANAANLPQYYYFNYQQNMP